jgi:tetratricopeptide (TPR) repeat protein
MLIGCSKWFISRRIGRVFIFAILFSLAYPSYADDVITTTEQSKEPILAYPKSSWLGSLSLGDDSLARRRYEEARGFYLSALAKTERADDPQAAAAVAFSKIAHSYFSQRQYHDCESAYSKALVFLHSGSRKDKNAELFFTERRLLESDILCQLAACEYLQGKRAVAEASLSKALWIAESVPAEPETCKAAKQLTRLLQSQGKKDDLQQRGSDCARCRELLCGRQPIGRFSIDYLNELQTRIHLAFQDEHGGNSGQATAYLTIPKSGGKSEMHTISQDPMLSQIAMATINKISPLPPLPDDTEGEWRVEVDFYFDLRAPCPGPVLSNSADHSASSQRSPVYAVFVRLRNDSNARAM